MRVSPTGQSEFHNGNEIGRYGRMSNDAATFVWYHCGLRRANEPSWAMDTDVEWKISISVDTILVVATGGDEATVYAIDRDAFAKSVEKIDGREQCVARASDDFVTEVGGADKHLRGSLWITCDNAHGGYHKDANEA